MINISIAGGDLDSKVLRELKYLIKNEGYDYYISNNREHFHIIKRGKFGRETLFIKIIGDTVKLHSLTIKTFGAAILGQKIANLFEEYGVTINLEICSDIPYKHYESYICYP